jgi:hypothetical protein
MKQLNGDIISNKKILGLQLKTMYQTAGIRSVENYQLFASNGNPIRKATQVIFNDGSKIQFMEKMPRHQAIIEAFEMKRRVI